MKLAARIMLLFLAVVVLMTAAGSYFSVRRSFERFEQRQQEAARTMAEAADSRLAEAWRDGGSDGLLAAMQTLSQRDPNRHVRWVWFEQTRIHDSDSARVVEQTRAIGNGPVSTTYTDDNGRRHLHTYYPIELGDSPRGGLEIVGSLESLDTELRETIGTALATLGGIALFSLGLVYVAGVRWVTNPLARLIDKTKRIGRGDFEEPLPIRGNDELSHLARALNDMSVQLADQQQRLHTETTERLATLNQLRHADRLKTVGRLAAGIAHELGTPLNVVSGRAELIASGKLSAEEVNNSAHAIKSEADRVTGIVRQLLEFARPGKSQRTQVDLSELLRQTTALVKPLAEKRHVRIETDNATASLVSVNRNQLQQVLTNLLVNAAQSMPDGGLITASVETCSAPRPDADSTLERHWITVTICDQGTGIDPNDLEHIFEPFFTTKDVGEGTGLGLSIAYGIVQEHGGWIDVESEPGNGSCFRVYLPRE